MAQTVIEKAAAKIRRSYDTGKPCKPVRTDLPDGDLDAAYAVQKINTDHWLTEGRRLVGRKIGLTSKAIQGQLGVDQPDFGMLYADMALVDGEEVPAGAVLQPMAEAEIAFVLDDDLTSSQLTVVDVINAIAYALPAIEVVGSRIAKWDIKIVDTVADNASSGMFVVGSRPVMLDEIDLRMCGMVMENRGEQVSVGAGAACLGNPLNAILWLARKMVEIGMPLKAGDIVLSGALGPMVPCAPGDVLEARISGLGSVRAAFAA